MAKGFTFLKAARTIVIATNVCFFVSTTLTRHPPPLLAHWRLTVHRLAAANNETTTTFDHEIKHTIGWRIVSAIDGTDSK